MANTAKKTEAYEPRNVGFCAYIGPTIMGVIQTGTIYTGNLNSAIKQAAAAIEKYPLISKLIIPGDRLAETKAQFAKNGSYLNVIYNRLVKEVNK